MFGGRSDGWAWARKGLGLATLILMSPLLVRSEAIAQRLAVPVDQAADAGTDDPPLAFGLYSSRNFPPLEEQFRVLAELGYRQVEINPTAIVDPPAYKAMLDRHGLATPTGHFGVAAMRADLSGCTALARLFGINVLVMAWLAPDERPRDSAGWAAFGGELQQMAVTLTAGGFSVAWQQHDFEFDVLADGGIPLEILFDSAPDVLWQADIGWISRAGEDPLPWLERYADRIVSVHLKDVSETPLVEGGWADVGYGVTNWRRLLPVLRQAGAVNWIVEHDDPSDYVRFARRSLATVTSW